MDFCETSAFLILQITVEDDPHGNESFSINLYLSSYRFHPSSILLSSDLLQFW